MAGGRQPPGGRGGDVIVAADSSDGSVLRRLRPNVLGYSTGNSAGVRAPAANVKNKLCQHAMI